MSLLDALLLGILQGLTEFLPISSSGHLVLGKAILGVEMPGLLFEVTVHLATAGAVVLAYRRRVRGMLEALRLAWRPSLWRGSADEDPSATETRHNFYLDCYVVLGTLPAVAAGLLLHDLVADAFTSTRMVFLMLILTGLILLLSRLAARVKPRQLDWRRSLTVGAAQCLSLLPGVSRSGTTITTGLLLGLPPGRAAEYSFLLSLPAILGATVLELITSFGEAPLALESIWPLVVGLVSAFFSGYFAIFFLLKVLQKGSFDRFAWYCLAVGGLGILFF